METHFAKAEMLIRKPLAEVFDAFINPEITTKFWFTKSSGKLEPGKQLQWTWEMYDHTDNILVKAVEPQKRIVIEWGAEPDRTQVTWTFTPMEGDTTFVSVVNDQLKGDTEKLIAYIRDATEGFALVLAGLKAYLEHNLQLQLIGDRFPAGLGA
ncbi:polyketide cyclase [Chitinophaga agrisoli]|uniref:Polyketide cyclase n=1 Tax=Chitinophaga agrisoli TaxID=2607653 RepID=A0A5B2VLR7_9BACT|nr:SRPBCC family protein [Chitinophaga agrisoli]KAA2239436.1 polyketide cyclase [Chitinophaga agrisoli]